MNIQTIHLIYDYWTGGKILSAMAKITEVRYS